jgi:hypothetical protein
VLSIQRIKAINVGFEVLTAVIVISMAWDITPCSPEKISRRLVHPKRRLAFNALRGVISQKRELFITTLVRTPNPTLSSCMERLLIDTFDDSSSQGEQDQTPLWPNLPSQVQGPKRCSASYLLHSGFSLGLLFDPEDRDDIVLRNFGLTFRLHVVISQNIQLFRRI